MTQAKPTLPANLSLRELQFDDDVKRLSLGDQASVPLKTFLKRDAKDFHAKNIAKTYVWVDSEAPPRVWGYVTLVCSQIDLADGAKPDDCKGAKRYRDFPAVKVARLAVDKDVRKQDLGKRSVELAIAMTIRAIMPLVGCRFLVVDSKPKAIKFYEKLGFTLLDTEANRKAPDPILFLDLHKLAGQ